MSTSLLEGQPKAHSAIQQNKCKYTKLTFLLFPLIRVE